MEDQTRALHYKSQVAIKPSKKGLHGSYLSPKKNNPLPFISLQPFYFNH
jgi:hypothetical protein